MSLKIAVKGSIGGGGAAAPLRRLELRGILTLNFKQCPITSTLLKFIGT